MKFPVYPKIPISKFYTWNEIMFKKYNNERVYHHPNPLIRFVENCRVSTIISDLKPVTASDLILCAGCGEGYIESRLKTNQLVLVDISRRALNLARKGLPRLPRHRFVRANLEHLPMRAGTFSKIECSEVVEHVLSPRRLLSELSRVVKPSGLLVISFPNEPFINSLKKIFLRLGLFYRIFPNVPKDMTVEWHLRSMDLSKFKEFAHPCWQIVHVHPIPWAFLPIRYVVVCRPWNKKFR